MTFLILVSLLWAFSFGLIKTHLGGLDASLVTLIRLTLSLLLFLPPALCLGAAGPLAVEAVQVRSGGKGQEGFYSYMELRDEKVVFFVGLLGQGFEVLGGHLGAGVEGQLGGGRLGDFATYLNLAPHVGEIGHATVATGGD